MNQTALKAQLIALGVGLFAMFLLLGVGVHVMFDAAIAVVMLACTGVVVQYLFGVGLALRWRGAEEMSEDKYPRVYDVVSEICKEINVEGVWLMVAEDDRMDVIAGGKKERGVVIIGNELLTELTDEEIKAVLAHEIAHVRNRDGLVLLGAQTLGMIGGVLAYFAVLTSVTGVGSTVFIAGYLTAVLVNALVSLGIIGVGRQREYAADMLAADCTSNETVVSALEKLYEKKTVATEESQSLYERGIAWWGTILQPPLKDRREKLLHKPRSNRQKINL